MVQILRSFYRNIDHLFVQYLSVLGRWLLRLVRCDCFVVDDERCKVVKHLIQCEELAIVDDIGVRLDFDKSSQLRLGEISSLLHRQEVFHSCVVELLAVLV